MVGALLSCIVNAVDVDDLETQGATVLQSWYWAWSSRILPFQHPKGWEQSALLLRSYNRVCYVQRTYKNSLFLYQVPCLVQASDIVNANSMNNVHWYIRDKLNCTRPNDKIVMVSNTQNVTLFSYHHIMLVQEMEEPLAKNHSAW